MTHCSILACTVRGSENSIHIVFTQNLQLQLHVSCRTHVDTSQLAQSIIKIHSGISCSPFSFIDFCAVTWSNQHGFLQLNRTKPPETPVLHYYTKNVNYKKHPSALTITLTRGCLGLHEPPFVLPALSFHVVLLLSFLPHSLQAISALRVVGKGGQHQVSSLVLKSVSLRQFLFIHIHSSAKRCRIMGDRDHEVGRGVCLFSLSSSNFTSFLCSSFLSTQFSLCCPQSHLSSHHHPASHFSHFFSSQLSPACHCAHPRRLH